MDMKQNILLFSLLSVFLFGCSEPPVIESDVIPSVKTLKVTERYKGQARRLSGRLEAADTSALSFAVSGTVEKVLVARGETVAQGQLLAQLETRTLEAQLDSARAELNLARAQLNDRKQRYERIKVLLTEGATSQTDVDTALIDLNSANTSLVTAQTRVSDAMSNIENAAIVAPFDGQITERAIEPFQEIQVGANALTIQSTIGLLAEVSVPETMIRNVEYGQVVDVSFPTLKAVNVKGVVNEIGAMAATGNAFPVKIILAPGDLDLRVGMTASVTFEFGNNDNQDIVMIPLSAIAIEAGLASAAANNSDRRNGSAPVFVYSEQSQTVELRNVQVGELRDNQVSVYSGLQQGEEIVVAGVAFLHDGMTVTRWDADAGLTER